jgi:DNA-binding response OmpR family regulator
VTPPSRSARILVVDDEPAVRQLVIRALQPEGYEVIAVADGQAALDAVDGADAPYDLVITNTHLAHLSGVELIDRLSRLFPGLPVLHLDDLSRPQHPVVEPAATLYRPFSVDALVSEVRRLVRQRAAG